PRRGVPALAGRAPGKVMDEVLGRDRDARRATVDHAADRRPMGFTEGGDAEKMAEWVHGAALSSLWLSGFRRRHVNRLVPVALLRTRRWNPSALRLHARPPVPRCARCGSPDRDAPPRTHPSGRP